MIKSFKHKGLEKFFKRGTTQGIQAAHKAKLRTRLAVLDSATCAGDINMPGYKLHPLKGDRDDIWSISVNGNWRLTFRFEDGDVYILNYEDYH